MVVLAVTWMAKVGHEAEVAALFEKLTEHSRKEPGCAMSSRLRFATCSRICFENAPARAPVCISNNCRTM